MKTKIIAAIGLGVNVIYIEERTTPEYELVRKIDEIRGFPAFIWKVVKDIDLFVKLGKETNKGEGIIFLEYYLKYYNQTKNDFYNKLNWFEGWTEKNYTKKHQETEALELGKLLKYVEIIEPDHSKLLVAICSGYNDFLVEKVSDLIVSEMEADLKESRVSKADQIKYLKKQKKARKRKPEGKTFAGETLVSRYKNAIEAISDTIEPEPEPVPEPVPEPAKKPKGSIETPELMAVIEMIKTNPYYNGIKGKRLKLLYRALIESKIIAKERTGSAFHRLCKEKFNWGVGAYNAMNGYVFNESTDQEEFNQMLTDIKTAISTK